MYITKQILRTLAGHLATASSSLSPFGTRGHWCNDATVLTKNPVIMAAMRLERRCWNSRPQPMTSIWIWRGYNQLLWQEWRESLIILDCTKKHTNTVLYGWRICLVAYFGGINCHFTSPTIHYPLKSRSTIKTPWPIQIWGNLLAHAREKIYRPFTCLDQEIKGICWHFWNHNGTRYKVLHPLDQVLLVGCGGVEVVKWRRGYMGEEAKRRRREV